MPTAQAEFFGERLIGEQRHADHRRGNAGQRTNALPDPQNAALLGRIATAAEQRVERRRNHGKAGDYNRQGNQQHRHRA